MTTATEPTKDDVILSLADIQNAVKVIDFAAEQGAFKGWNTIEQVLNVRNRLNTFISAAQANQPPAEGATDGLITETPEAPAAEAQG